MTRASLTAQSDPDDDDEYLDTARVSWHETNGWIAEIEDNRNVYMNAHSMGFIPLQGGEVMSDVLNDEDDSAVQHTGSKVIAGMQPQEERRLLSDLLSAYWPGELIKLLSVVALLIGGLMSGNDVLSTILILASIYAAFQHFSN